ncbi:hypothetical protein U9M48_005325 [Paspalum notatum var. saurae]|uniref:Uncharacterized protein n=1 Tax=Paspalum notatum var. saurae TaxID=547442 RepID=A0AAQ3PXE7_PASNO
MATTTPEATGRVHGGLVGDGRRKRSEQQQGDLERDAEQNCEDQGEDVYGCRHLPGAPGGEGAHEADEVEHHAHPERQHDDGQRRDEGRRVAVEEGQVAARVVVAQHRVADDMAGLVLLPEAARRAHAGLVRQAGCEDGQEQQELAALLQLPLHVLVVFLLLLRRRRRLRLVEQPLLEPFGHALRQLRLHHLPPGRMVREHL